MESIHEGHRQRLRLRFMEHGMGNFSDIEVLELLLFYAVPRRDTNELAHRLLGRFGSLRSVLEAEADQLQEVPGLGENAAILLKIIPAVSRRYMLASRRDVKCISSTQEAGDYLLPLFAYENEEVVYLLSLDTKSAVTNCRQISRGIVNTVNFSSREIVDAALRDNAARVILAHNHLSGTALPSSADITATKRLKSAMGLIGVELLDHIIVCDGDFVSMRESGCFE
jgi:DNA repair protein RadC